MNKDFEIKEIYENVEDEMMDNILEAINDYYHNHGHYPKVKVSYDFYKENEDDLIRAYNGGITIVLEYGTDQWELE